MPEVSVPWGCGEMTFALPEHWTLQQAAQASLRAAPADWPDRLATALAQPGTGLPLEKLLAARRDGRIVIVVEDLTRSSPLPQILDVVMREIRHAKIADGQVSFFFAAGMHPPLTAKEAKKKLGPWADAFSWRNNLWKDAKAYVSVGHFDGMDVQIDRGVADADLRIIIGSVSPHLQAGFGGGYKMFLPGAAAQHTIRALHQRGLGREFRQRVGTDGQCNRMRLLIDGGGQLVDARHGATFAIQYLLDGANLPSSVAAGEVLPTQRMMAKQCAVSCGVVVPQPADVLIANAHPRDFDLWQSFKCIPNTMWAARPNGVVICLARSEAGQNGMNFPQIPLSTLWARRLMKWLGPEMVSSVATRAIPHLAGDAAFFVRLAAQAVKRNPIFMVSPALHQAGVRFPGMDVFGTVAEAVDAATKLLGNGPQKVVVFASGGTTYPVPPPEGAGRGAP